MPFILDDQELINQLLKHGQEFENRFTRQGQAAVNANAALTQLLDSLEGQLHPERRPPGTSPEVSTQSNTPAQLNVVALEGLGALVDFLAANTITIDGQRIAFHQSEKPQGDNYQLVQLEPNALYNETPNRQIQTKGYYVDMDLLKKYISTLQGQLVKRPNPVMQVQLSKIINEANKSLNVGMSETYQPQAQTLNDNQVLDTFPNALDPKNYTAEGPVQLIYGDIKSPEDLNNWISSNSISVNNRMINHPQFDFCGVIQTIHNKAKWHLSRATPQTKSMFTMYVQQIEKIAPSITGPDGKACQLSGTTSAQQGQSGTGGVTAENVMHVIQSLPLRPSDIDFGRIDTFFTEYRKILSTNAADITGAMTQAEEAMKKASSQTTSGMRNFPMSANAQQIGTWVFQDLAQARALSVLANLRYIVSGVAAVISHLKTTQGQQLGGPSLAAINGQIGDDANSQGIAGINLNHIQTMESQINSQGSPGTPVKKPYRGY